MRLGEDLLHVHPIYRKNHHRSQQDDERILSISDVMSRGKTSPTGLSLADATVLVETVRKVPTPRYIPPQHLMPVVVRPDQDGVAIFRTHGPDF